MLSCRDLGIKLGNLRSLDLSECTKLDKLFEGIYEYPMNISDKIRSMKNLVQVVIPKELDKEDELVIKMFEGEKNMIVLKL